MIASLRIRLPLRLFLSLMPIIGLALAFWNDYYHSFIADYSADPLFKTFADEVKDFVYPMGVGVVLFIVFFKCLTSFLFGYAFDRDKLIDGNRTNKSNHAFLNGLALIFLGSAVYMLVHVIYGSPARYLVG